MKILFLSDTPGEHYKLKDLPPADILIHSGDIFIIMVEKIKIF